MWKKIEVLSSIEKVGSDLIFETVNGSLGIVLGMQSLDVELIQDESLLKSFNAIIKEIPHPLSLKFISKTHWQNVDLPNLSRTEPVAHLGFRRDQNFLIITTEGFNLPFLRRMNRQFIAKLQDVAQRFKDMVVSISPNAEQTLKPFDSVSKEIIESLFLPIGTTISSYPDYLVIDQKLVGIVRIKSNSHQSLSLESMSSIRAALDFDHEVISNFKRLSGISEGFIVKNLQGEAKIAKDLTEFNRKEEVEKLSEALTHLEEGLFEVEVLFKVMAANEPELRSRLRKVADLLQKEFNSHYVESFGVYPSYCSSFPGSNSHVTFKELGSGLLYYTPIFSSHSAIQQQDSPMTLRMHRRGGHLHSVSLIDNLYQSGNSMIIGPKGSGKSVLCGLLTQSLFNDPTVQILKIDVGSSYKRECQKLGGTYYSLELNEPSGLNPLEVLARVPHDLEIASIVADFIEVLIAKNAQGTLSDEERASLDRVVIAYSESRPPKPSLDDVAKFAIGKIPNPMLLERWTEGGMYANIFKPRPDQINSRYRYFDFKSVNNSTNPSLVRGSIAAVIAQYNSEVAISGRNGPRIFLFCDETTEFLNLCSPFFITTAKNSRKFGHATILINQESASFQVRDRKGDLTNSLFDNTDHHFLFSTPGDPEDAVKFQARHKMDGAEFQRAKTLSYQKGKFSEVFYKTRIGGQVLRIELSKEEYWLLTSDKNDYDKIDRLKEVGFSEEEAILCLSQLHSRLY